MFFFFFFYVTIFRKCLKKMGKSKIDIAHIYMCVDICLGLYTYFYR
ncbi:hypothetical protein [Plasmodium yoelii yoelii]|uniref:Uncharacterized protein n=1 Tax=Plasmodium yoelii yoelii TaxID=73239 RepID=Q7PD85_PLAYO|nr:hypothetical protein [Plasmodium yoelii yoelii]EAA18889.1 hypothetical protein [Plasmodium yoelii yoelii]